MSIEKIPNLEVEQPKGLVTAYLFEKIKYNLRGLLPPFCILGEDSNESFSYHYEVDGLASTDFVEVIFRERLVHNSFFLRFEFSNRISDHKINRIEAGLARYAIFNDGAEILSEESFDSNREDHNDLSIWRIFWLLKKTERLFNVKELITS